MSSASFYSYRFDLPATVERCFELFSDPNRLNELTPAWFDLRPTGEAGESVSVGTEIPYRLRWRGFPMRWTSRIVEWSPPHLLTYEQARGPYIAFRHEHRFRSIAGGTEVLDQVSYRPYGGRLADRLVVRRDLERIFGHRATHARRLLAREPDRMPMADSSASSASARPRGARASN